ncbi:unnamed protein product [Cladocopium goreaui]|uniref:E3 ubiquitin-protein ligase TRIM50 (RING-type E 3 ubiquitin transferase TRIM50) (Tripartite motif-containing protein 50) n=1 Tax=Cladocopium goreaui TaxID=2562237 RepID=A0A9P1GFP4_9DINO|nr:unnamed protein product [Cladocopium goreaui]
MECPICLEPYTGSRGPHLPKVFSCGHSICELCLKEFSGAQLECALCRATVDAAHISTNYALCSVLDAEIAQAPSNTARTGSTTARSSSPSPKARSDDGFFSMTEDSDDDDPLPAGRRGNGRAQADVRRTFAERWAPSAPPLTFEQLDQLDPELAPSAPPFATAMRIWTRKNMTSLAV